jgi:hypothetical protein
VPIEALRRYGVEPCTKTMRLLNTRLGRRLNISGAKTHGDQLGSGLGGVVENNGELEPKIGLEPMTCRLRKDSRPHHFGLVRSLRIAAEISLAAICAGSP